MSKRNDITIEAIETALMGRDPQERIVNLEYNYQDDFIKVYYRDEDDMKHTAINPFYPFVWARLDACMKMLNAFDGNREALNNFMHQNNIWVRKLSIEYNDGRECAEMLNGYRFIFYATKPMSYSEFLNFFKRVKCPIYGNKKGETTKKEERLFICISPQEQFLISTGKRFFKGYDDYNQVLRMIFDLETEGLDPLIDRIKLNGIRFNRPAKAVDGRYYEKFENIFRIIGNTKEEKDTSELKVIDDMLRIIYTFKPDIITAHNGENFDWNFIIERCKQLGTSLEKMSKKYFGGDYIYKDTKESILKLGGEIETFKRTIVPTTIVTDSLHAVRRAQATDSSFKKADLKYATGYLNLKKKNRVYTVGSEIDNILCDTEAHYAFNNADGDWYLYDKNAADVNVEFKKGKEGDKPFVMYTRNYIADGYELVTGEYIITRYLLDDLYECDAVEYSLNSPDFSLCKIIPVTFQKCCTMGTAGQWKSIMMAWSYENNLAIPFAENTGSFTGGLSRLLKTGFVDRVIKLDYNSLYPSIILTWGIEDSKDLSGATLKFLEHILSMREKHKKLKKSAGKIVDAYELKMNNGEHLTEDELKEYNEAVKNYKIEDNRQMVFKKVGNSFFGAYGSNNGAVYPWKSIDCAERTTCTGRQSLRLMISHFKNLGYEPIVGDTDGFNFKLPYDFRYTDENPYIGKGLSRETTEGKAYTGYEADVAEFNDLYMGREYFKDSKCLKMGLGIDEIVDATINFSRKNYADYFPEKPYPSDVKLVGNTIKSKKLPVYIEKFLDKAVRLLLQGKGQEFLTLYYDTIEKIYNYNIPIKDIANKGKVKKSLDEYIADCQTITKSGSKKSRQAWMELALRDNVKVNLGETLYYINVGKKKGDKDVQRITKYIGVDPNSMFGEETDVTKIYKKEYTKSEKGYLLPKEERPSFSEYMKLYHPEIREVDEVILFSKLVPSEIINSETDVYCADGEEYNAAKYIDQFNSRITPLLVCFSKEIRGKILITNPDDRQYFTEAQAQLVNGQPNKEGDQDTYEQLMTMDDKEIRFWMSHPEWKIPFLEECGMDWEYIKNDYKERKEKEKQLGIDRVREKYEEVLRNLTTEELDDVEEGKLPSGIANIIEIDPKTNNFVSKEYKDIIIGSIYDFFEAREFIKNKLMDDYDEILEKREVVE